MSSQSKPVTFLESMRKLFTVLQQFRWGDLTQICLCISILSGVVVALQFEYSTPFYSTVSLDLLVPFGGFFRSLHFYSSQLAFLLTCIHLLMSYSKTARYKQIEWAKLIFTLPALLLLLFTGYILRGDATGTSAGTIAEHIFALVPVVGHSINNLFFSISESGLRRVYVNHVAGLDLLLLFLLWQHLRQFRLAVRPYLPHCLGLLIYSAFFNAPLDPFVAGEKYISGPWFFLGLQELLRYFSPIIAGFILPCAFLYLLFKLQPSEGTGQPKQILRLFWASIILYCFLTFIAWFR